MELRVDCEPGLGGDPEPAVVWFGARRVEVLAIQDRWWGPGLRWWKLETGDGMYILRREEGSGTWDLAAVARN
ncbi:hypothetical protein GCM10027034_18440 [Ramlibacter solisilvae]|uniref:Uncharacterized protein n=1 Tax=Ramlibacter tataouinensis TaxID=94132 RepID=A0A127JVX7_9BURK|nr:hypothetical protein [Ramlibacter tataouinensis]AMO24033.1 hypothetical protein UC35_15680 [Ramlibacter tataouinensis]